MRIEAAFPDLRQPMEVEDTGREEERKEKSHRAAVAGHVSGHDRGGDGDICWIRRRSPHGAIARGEGGNCTENGNLTRSDTGEAKAAASMMVD